jgi:hypothetical protein
VLTRPDGERYCGHWRNGHEHHYGELTLANGEKYNGYWRNGKKHCYGIRTTPDGRAFRQRWEYGRLIKQTEVTNGEIIEKVLAALKSYKFKS